MTLDTKALEAAEYVEAIAKSMHDMDSDNYDLPWEKQPPRVRAQARRQVRSVLAASALHRKRSDIEVLSCERDHTSGAVISVTVWDTTRLTQESLSATPSRNDILEEAARKFGADKRLSLAYHDKVYGDDDDLPTHGKWVIWRETGNINDREWEVVSSGDTPAAAIRALVKP